MPDYEGSETSQLTLTAQAVEEALEERILTGTYAPGSTLPSVRALAAELGTSPSTVSRALQGLERRRWVNVADRRGASVASTIPQGDEPVERAADALRVLATQWRLYGRSAEDFRGLVDQVVADAFRPPPAAFFVECNLVDVATVGGQLQGSIGFQIESLLLAQLRGDPASATGAIVLTSFFHLAEVRGIVPLGTEIIPLNLVPSEEAMRALSELARDASVVAIGQDDRTTQQIAGLASHYALTAVVGASLADPVHAAALAADADVVVVTNATQLPREIEARARRLVVVGFELERGGLGPVRAALHAAESDPAGLGVGRAAGRQLTNRTGRRRPG